MSCRTAQASRPFSRTWPHPPDHQMSDERRIRDLLRPGPLGASTALVLLGLIFFFLHPTPLPMAAHLDREPAPHHLPTGAFANFRRSTPATSPGIGPGLARRRSPRASRPDPLPRPSAGGGATVSLLTTAIRRPRSAAPPARISWRRRAQLSQAGIGFGRHRGRFYYDFASTDPFTPRTREDRAKMARCEETILLRRW